MDDLEAFLRWLVENDASLSMKRKPSSRACVFTLFNSTRRITRIISERKLDLTNTPILSWSLTDMVELFRGEKENKDDDINKR